MTAAISQPQDPSNGPSYPDSTQPRPQVPEDFQPPPYPDGQICREPRSVSYHDTLNQLCYDLMLPCGVGEELAADRYRQEHGLERNPAVRFFSPESLSSEAPVTSSGPDASNSSSGNDEKSYSSYLMNSARAYVREVRDIFDRIQIPSLFHD